MVAKTGNKSFDAAVARIAGELKQRHNDAMWAAQNALGDGKVGTVTANERDFEAEARDLLGDAVHAMATERVLANLKAQPSAPWKGVDGVAPPCPTPPRTY